MVQALDMPGYRSTAYMSPPLPEHYAVLPTSDACNNNTIYIR